MAKCHRMRQLGRQRPQLELTCAPGFRDPHGSHHLHSMMLETVSYSVHFAKRRRRHTPAPASPPASRMEPSAHTSAHRPDDTELLVSKDVELRSPFSRMRSWSSETSSAGGDTSSAARVATQSMSVRMRAHRSHTGARASGDPRASLARSQDHSSGDGNSGAASLASRIRSRLHLDRARGALR